MSTVMLPHKKQDKKFHGENEILMWHHDKKCHLFKKCGYEKTMLCLNVSNNMVYKGI